MRIFIAILLAAACLSGAYYFKASLPSEREGAMTQEDYSKAAKAFFDAVGHAKGIASDYIYHYSRKEKRFFILIRSLSRSKSNGRGTLRTEDLYDLLSNEHCGTFIYQTFVSGRAPSVGWQLFDRNGKLESEWAEAIKPYMEE